MNKTYIPKSILSKIMGVSVVYIPLIFFTITSKEYTTPFKIFFLIFFSLINVGLVFFIRVKENKIFIANSFWVYNIAFEDIIAAHMGFHKRKMDIPAIEIYIVKGEKIKIGYIYYLQYRREDIVEIIRFLKMKNSSLELCRNIEEMIEGKDTVFDDEVRRKIKAQNIILLVCFAIGLITALFKLQL